MPAASITTNLDKPLDVEVDLLPELPLHPISLIDELADTVNLLLTKLSHLGIRIDPGAGQYLSA